MEPESQTRLSPLGVTDLRLGLYVLILMLFWAAVFAYTVHPILPANPIQLPLEEKSPFLHLLPQGWAFFTRDPKTLEILPFVKNPDGTWHVAPAPKLLWPHPPNFSRSWKLPGIEVGMILSELPDPQWQACQESPPTCLVKAPQGETVKNLMTRLTLCGEIGLVRQPPIPWAWRESADETVMPSEVLRLQVSCHE